MDSCLKKGSTGEETGLMGDDIPVAELGDPAVVKEWALLEWRGLGGLVMTLASAGMKEKKKKRDDDLVTTFPEKPAKQSTQLIFI